MVRDTWEQATSLPPLDPDTVNLIHFRLDAPSSTHGESYALLNLAERNRAGRFKRPIHQSRFAIGRARLRSILAFYTGWAPEEIEFSYGPQGKPALGEKHSAWRLGFNLSHTGDDAVCAVAPDRNIGVDVEQCVIRDSSALAIRYFHEEESAAMMALEDEVLRRNAFYRLWTAKEALLKGAGGGLTLPLNRCCFQLDQDPFGLSFVDLPTESAAGWQVFPFTLSEERLGAVAVDGPAIAWNLVRWNPA